MNLGLLFLGVSALISPVGSLLRVVLIMFVFRATSPSLFADEQRTPNHTAKAVLTLLCLRLVVI